MSNPTELPDLAEAVRKLVKAKGRFHTEQNYKELADALARYDARRAQPEGEAPQAAPLSEVQIDRIARAYFSEQWAVQHAKDAIHDAFEDARKSASLSPLCGAQHAESGKEAGLTIGEAFKAVGGWMNGGELGYPSFGSMDALRVYTQKMVRSALAAQQAAAPGAIPDQSQFEAQAKYQGATDFTLVHPDFARCNNGWEPATYRDPMTELAWRVWANKRVAPSAPGTPEAPRELPPLPTPTARMYSQNGYRRASVSAGKGEPLFAADQMRDYARAAQLDGDQEGSESNG